MYVKCGIVFVAIIYLKFSPEDGFNTDVHVKGKNILITGASSGIGEQLAYHYAGMGANVFITARREDLLKTVIHICKRVGFKDARFGYFVADMELYETAARDVTNAAISVLGSIDQVIINHALLPTIKRWNGTDTDLRTFEKQLDINLVSYVYLASQVIPHLKKSNGKMGIISSMAGKMTFPFGAGYSAAKFALDGFFSSLRQEFKINNDNITITMCNLGWIGTDQAKESIDSTIETGFKRPSWFADTSDTAIEIIKSTSLGHRELYFPPLFGSTFFRSMLPVIRHLW